MAPELLMRNERTHREIRPLGIPVPVGRHEYSFGWLYSLICLFPPSTELKRRDSTGQERVCLSRMLSRWRGQGTDRLPSPVLWEAVVGVSPYFSEAFIKGLCSIVDNFLFPPMTGLHSKYLISSCFCILDFLNHPARVMTCRHWRITRVCSSISHTRKRYTGWHPCAIDTGHICGPGLSCLVPQSLCFWC